MTTTLTKRTTDLLSTKTLALIEEAKLDHPNHSDNEFMFHWHDNLVPLISEEFPINSEDPTNTEIWDEIYKYIRSNS